MPNANFKNPLTSFGGFTTTICICILLSDYKNLFADKFYSRSYKCDAEQGDKYVVWYYISEKDADAERYKHRAY